MTLINVTLKCNHFRYEDRGDTRVTCPKTAEAKVKMTIGPHDIPCFEIDWDYWPENWYPASVGEKHYCPEHK